ncbi:ATP-dependent zinc metalloprotease FtsH [Clostridium polyendosporum]|uniref:ATP-dependent zinc metalloprotease FtsH n=1 Tax=Clostridium polyendosporum TaxID=69208 RepID=A0A919RZR4_9CLOT|nr:ATP-dependent zinc metalloprotease FtsH [Clostridium polyendosporum]GIM28789.1 ATP-dependent zinc metalloprotease FtsH [Clostridium polyendosporum]
MFKNNKKLKYLAIYGLMVIGLLFIFNYMKTEMSTKNVTYNQFKVMLKEKKIESVVITSERLIIKPNKQSSDYGKTLYTVNLGDKDLISQLSSAGVEFTGRLPERLPLIDLILYWIGPIIFFFFLGRMMFGKIDKKMGGGVMSFGKNTAKLYAEDETGKTFADVAGQEEAKESLKEIVDFLHDPKKYQDIGAKLPKGALLVGPPGTGKTLLAKAVAGEAKVPFFSMSGSDFVELFVGMGASRVRDLFRQAEEKAPCIIFIDEIDAIGKSRDSSPQGNDEREQTLNQLLAEMDGFDSSKGVVILAATNRPEILDKALLRPGRFDRRVIVDRPDLKGRISILKVHAKEVKLGNDVDLEAIAKGTPGAVGADLANIVNEAALRAVKHNRKVVLQEDLEEAVEVIIAGKEKKDRILSPKEKRIVAFHEVGHALMAALLKNTDPVHKITIVPRTMGALGYTMQLPEEEKYLVTKDEMIDQIMVMLGGRAAEEIEFNLISTGASNDIERATQSARSMVTIYGMTEKFDMMALESMTNRYLDGRPIQNCSAETAAIIDEETLKIIKECHKKAKDLLTENRDLLDKISCALLDKETLTGEEFMAMVYEKYSELRIEKENKEAEKKALENRFEKSKDFQIELTDEDKTVKLETEPSKEAAVEVEEEKGI